MKKLAVLIIVLSFTLTGCYTTCKYRDKNMQKAADSEVMTDTASGE